MEWCFETGGGAVTVCQEGDRAICQALRNVRGEGLYKAWLCGARSRFLLGTLIPEGGALRLRRSVSLNQLKAQGVWPPTGASIVSSLPYSQQRLPDGFRREEQPWRLVPDPAVSPCLRRAGECCLRQDGGGFLLALPFDPAGPFPVPPLFCLSRVAQLEGRLWVLFRFSPGGEPVLPEEAPEQVPGKSSESDAK